MEEKKKLPPSASPKWPDWPSVSDPWAYRWYRPDLVILAYGFCMVVGGSAYLLVNLFLWWFGWAIGRLPNF